MMFLIVTTICDQGTENPVHLKKGVLLQELGEVNLISNLVLIKKNVTQVAFCQEKAKLMLESLNTVIAKENDTANLKLLEQAKSKLNEVVPRKKRSLLPFVGTMMHELFGVARDNDLEKEKERISKIESWANNFGNVINKVITNLNEHSENFQKLSNEVEKLEKRNSGNV